MNNRQIAAVYEDLKKLAGNEIRTAGGNDLVTVWPRYWISSEESLGNNAIPLTGIYRLRKSLTRRRKKSAA